MLEAPCKNCPKKGCGSYHDICKEYQQFREEWDRQQKVKKAADKLKSDINAVEVERKNRYRRTTHSKQR